MELRYFKSELRAESSGKDKVLRGVAIRYGTRSASYIATGTRERIASGAFSKSIRSGGGALGIRMLVEHDSTKLLGSVRTGALRLDDTADALNFECSLPATTYADDIYALVQRSEMGMSFGMLVDDDSYASEFDEDDDGNESEDRCMVRTVRSGQILEISAVSMPAYQTGSVLARSTFQLVSPEVRSAALAFHKNDEGIARARGARKLHSFLL